MMMRLFIYLTLIDIVWMGIDGNPVQPNKKVIIRSPNKFSVTRKNDNNFSYLEALNSNGLSGKKSVYNDQDLLKSIKTKLSHNKGELLKFSYLEAIRKYVESGRKIPVNSKISVIPDIVKSQVSQPRPIRMDSAVNVALVQEGASNTNIKSAVTAKPVTQATTKSTTEQQETEAPESEQASTGISTATPDSEQVAKQTSKCFCMSKCRRNLSVEGFCGQPDALGKRKFKCCSFAEPMSAEAGEYELE